MGSSMTMTMRLLACGLSMAATVMAVSTTITVNKGDILLEGGASFIPGHGAPTGISLRTGSPGQTTAASFPSNMVLSPGATITSISFSYRYVSGYGAAGVGHGTNLSLV